MYPSSGPHSVYAYYARAFTVANLAKLYRELVAAHSVDAIVNVHGGSDSLMERAPSVALSFVNRCYADL